MNTKTYKKLAKKQLIELLLKINQNQLSKIFLSLRNLLSKWFRSMRIILLIYLLSSEMIINL